MIRQQPILKECYSCHRRFTEQSFSALELRGYPDFVENIILEVRQCICGKLIGVERDQSKIQYNPVALITSRSDTKGGIHERIAH